MPVVFDQPNTSSYNSGTISGGAIIAASGVRLVNTDSGRIYGGVTFTAGGSTLENVLGGWIGLASNVITGPLIIGSDGDDVVINGGIMAGSIALGGGADTFIARSRSAGGVDLGSGDDTYRVETSDPLFIDAVAGSGTDRLVFAGTGGSYYADPSSGFEQLVFENGGNFTGFSGFQSISIGPLASSWPFVNLLDSLNPAADVLLNGQWLTLNRSSVRSVVGNDAANTLELGIGGVISNGAALGGGNDSLWLTSNTQAGAPVLVSAVTGGTGVDMIMLSWATGGDRTYDLSLATGFEVMNVNAWAITDPAIARVSHATGLTDINIGQYDTFILSDSLLPDARVGGAFGGGITLGAGVVIDRYGFPEDGSWDDGLNLAQGDPILSVRLTNHGAIENDVRFYIGDDRYDGRDGSIGGIVYGNAGNDRLLGGGGGEHFIGGYGADTLQGGGGADILTGGAGYDLFMDTRAGHNSDTITDFSRGDRLVFSDAALADFSYTVSGQVLNYSGGSLILQGFQGGLTASQAAEGGVQITFSSPPIVIAATTVTLSEAPAPKMVSAEAYALPIATANLVAGFSQNPAAFEGAAWLVQSNALASAEDLFGIA